MLTTKQQYLFQQLGIDPAAEKGVRQRHKVAVAEGRAVKDFTRYLELRVHQMWRQRNTVPYLGD